MTERILARDHRRHIPIGIKLKACLFILGFTEDEIDGDGQIEWDHHPCLAMRLVDEQTGELFPPPNDYRHIRPLRKADHSVKTNGPGGAKRICSAGGDQHAIAHTRRLAAADASFKARRDIVPDQPVILPAPKKASRPMPCGRTSRLKKRFDGKVVVRETKRSRP